MQGFTNFYFIFFLLDCFAFGILCLLTLDHINRRINMTLNKLIETKRTSTETLCG
jgi:hypothetical protein